MKNRILTLTALFTLACAAPAFAAEGANFVSGNANNDGQYKPRKAIQRKGVREPGFWDREWERSGLNKTAGKWKWNPFKDTAKFFKEKDEAYKAKKVSGTSNASAASAIK